MSYKELLKEAESKGITIEEYDLESHDGLCYGDLILINSRLETSKEKACILAEEIAHYEISVGDITDLNITENRKQEQEARFAAYNRHIDLQGIIQAYKKHCYTLHEMAEFLDVTEPFLFDALECYKSKYGICAKTGQYIIYFEPNLGIMELL